MKNILVLSDFSKCANNAVRYALKLADTYGNKLVFYHATYQYFLNEMPESESLAALTEANSQRSLFVFKLKESPQPFSVPI